MNPRIHNLRSGHWPLPLNLRNYFSRRSIKPTTESTARKVFASPADAGAAFLEAAKSGDQPALLAIFGPDGKTALFSGDAVKDKDNLQQDFVAAHD